MGTETSIDEFGRVVIPKRVRSNLGLEPGTVLEVDELEDGILLKASRRKPPLRVDGGVLVFTGKAAGDLEGAVRRHREERLANLTPKRTN
jgi:AbrB family looped-hinge helix DNA binding protein